jgi:hypothetical protein
MATPRELLDPGHTLPRVQFETFEDYGSEYFCIRREQARIVVNEDEIVGRLNLVSETRPDQQFAHFDGIEIFEENNRGRGIGLATYVLAIEMSHDRNLYFRTQNYELTKDSARVWRHLTERGVAQVVRPFVPSKRFPDRFVGEYHVPIVR